jgi:hypothetical protein
MKMPTLPLVPDGRPWWVALRAAAGGLGLLVSVAAASPERHYQLFVGLDLEVPWQEGFQPVRGVYNQQRGVEILVDGEKRRVLIDRADSLRMRRELKVGPAPAEIANLRAERVYSPLNDPARKWMSAQITMASQHEVQMQEAQGEVTRRALEFVNPGQYASPDSPTGDAFQDLMNRQSDAENFMARAAAPALSDPMGAANRMANEQARDLYDAIEVVFDVSAVDIIADAYVVMLANYKVAGRPENYRFIYTQSIGTVDTRPRKVRLWSGGLPMGYELLDTVVHLYSYGMEIPTNLSDKSVTVSEEQALRVLTASHLNTNRGRTLPARPLWQTAPPNFRARLDFRHLPATVRLDIDSDGKVTAVRDEQGEPLPVRGLLRDVLVSTRYLPALAEGTPVASTLSIEPARFLQ